MLNANDVTFEKLKEKFNEQSAVLTEEPDKYEPSNKDRADLYRDHRIMHNWWQNTKEDEKGTIKELHKQIVEEMTENRGLRHNSPIVEYGVENLTDNELKVIKNNSDNKELVDKAIEELRDKEELAEVSIHTPEYSGTKKPSWTRPSMEDFDTDDLSEIDDHFIVSMNGFPPEKYGDLKAPIVDSDGKVVLEGCRSAYQMAKQIDGLTEDEAEKVKNIANKVAKEAFDVDFTEEENTKDDEPEEIENTNEDEENEEELDNNPEDAGRDEEELTEEDPKDKPDKDTDKPNGEPEIDLSETNTEHLDQEDLEDIKEKVKNDIKNDKDPEDTGEQGEDGGGDSEEELEDEQERTGNANVTEVHTPTFASTSLEGDFEKPRKDDFDTGELTKIDDHFVLSKSGFPPEEFNDLKLCIVSEDGTLTRDALQNAKSGISQLEGVTKTEKRRAEQIINFLAKKAFGLDWAGNSDSEETNQLDQLTADEKENLEQMTNAVSVREELSEGLGEDEKRMRMNLATTPGDDSGMAFRINLEESDLEDNVITGVGLTNGVWNGHYWSNDIIKNSYKDLRDKQVDLEHNWDNVIGEVLETEYDPERGMLVKAKITDEDVLESIKNGVFKAFSIDAWVTVDQKKSIIKAIDDYNSITVTSNPACIESEIDQADA